MRKIIFFLFVALSVASYVEAQTAVWQISPSQGFTQLKRVAVDVYQATKAGETLLIHADGTPVVPMPYDELTGFREHKALVLKKEKERMRILGILSDRGQFTPLTQKYYTLLGQAFYSDGMLSVANGAGKAGYIDEEGQPVLGFDGKFDVIKPFTEGYAAVFRNKRYALIDKSGHRAQIIIGVGEVWSGTNVYKGKAYVKDADGKFYTYDVKTRKCVSVGKPSSFQLDYLSCFSCITKRGKTPHFNDWADTEPRQIGLSPFIQDGLYGYRENGIVILPCQFSAATPFEDGYAAVVLKGKAGLLKYGSEPGNFTLSVPQNHLVYAPGRSVTCAFSLERPGVWQSEHVRIAVISRTNGEQMALQESGEQYSFSIVPSSAEQVYDVMAFAEGLKLWAGELSYFFKKQEVRLRCSLTVHGTQADEDDRVYVTATIVNPNAEEVTTKVHLHGSETFHNETLTITIPANGSRSVKGYFVVKSKDYSNQSVTVTTDKGGSATQEGLTLRPFY